MSADRVRAAPARDRAIWMRGGIASHALDRRPKASTSRSRARGTCRRRGSYCDPDQRNARLDRPTTPPLRLRRTRYRECAGDTDQRHRRMESIANTPNAIVSRSPDRGRNADRGRRRPSFVGGICFVRVRQVRAGVRSRIQVGGSTYGAIAGRSHNCGSAFAVSARDRAFWLGASCTRGCRRSTTCGVR
jgi:hypothetical protein